MNSSGVKNTVPSARHAPPLKPGAAPNACGRPPARESFFSRPSAAKASDAPSGERKGPKPFSVPLIGGASKASSSRR